MIAHLSPKEKLGYAILGVLVLCALILVGFKSSYGNYKAVGGFDAGKLSSPKKAASPPLTPVPAEIVIYVTGKVKRPGVYRLKGPSRTVDAVNLAGGATSQADLEAINLAAPLADGEQVTVPGKDNIGPSSTSRASGSGSGQKLTRGSLSLNNASLDELRSLPGVGPGTAQKIFDYRKAHGAFTSIDQLRQVGGIGAKKLARLAPFLHL